MPEHMRCKDYEGLSEASSTLTSPKKCGKGTSPYSPQASFLYLLNPFLLSFNTSLKLGTFFQQCLHGGAPLIRFPLFLGNLSFHLL